MDTARTAYKEMIQYMLALKSPSFKTEDLAEDKDVASSITEAVKKFTGDDIPKQEYEYIKGQLSSEVALEDVNGTLKLRSTGFQQMIESLKNNSRATFEEQVAYAKTVHDNQSNMKKVYTKLCLYESYYTGYCNTLTDEEKGALSSEKNLYSQVLGDIKTIFDNVKKFLAVGKQRRKTVERKLTSLCMKVGIKPYRIYKKVWMKQLTA